MFEFGLADFTFSDPVWRPATLQEVKGTGADISTLGMKFLQDVSVCDVCIHIDGQVLSGANGRIWLTTTGNGRAGSSAVFRHHCVASQLCGDTGARNRRKRKGYVHIFVKDSGAKRRKTIEKPLGTFLWEDRSFPDAAVTCDQVRFEVHRAVLARNPVFKQGLSGSMVEARTAEFDIKCSEPGAVEALLKHIYTRETDAPKNVLVPLLALAVQYEEADLVQTVALALTSVSPDTVQAHARALKLHRDHPDVDAAYQKLCEAVSKDTSLIDRLV